MMKIYKTIQILFVLALFTSCNTEKAEQEKLYNQVMAIHDEVMPEMGNLMKLSKRLKVELDSAMSDTTEVQKTKIIELTKLIHGLESANESMMQWMREFKPIEEGTPHAAVMDFLMEEKEKIDQVKKDMTIAKETAENYFLKNQ